MLQLALAIETYVLLGLGELGGNEVVALLLKVGLGVGETALVKELAQLARVPVADREQHQRVVLLDKAIRQRQSLGAVIRAVESNHVLHVVGRGKAVWWWLTKRGCGSRQMMRAARGSWANERASERVTGSSEHSERNLNQNSSNNNNNKDARS